jgi:hypothetical protein
MSELDLLSFSLGWIAGGMAVLLTLAWRIHHRDHE